MTFWNSPSFKALQKHWYQRLEEAGFQDAEKLTGSEMVLKQHAAHVYKDVCDLERISKETYYVLISQLAKQAEFKCEVHRVIMNSHADGKRIKDICAELERIGSARARDTVRYIIRKYEMAWGLRVYSPRELHRQVR